MRQGTMNVIFFGIILAVFLFPPPGAAGADASDESFTVRNVRGDAILRPLGEYFWRAPVEGQEIEAGDRLRVRNGGLEIRLPQGIIAMSGPGEMEIPAEVVGGFAEPWRDDVRLFVGSYAITIDENRPLIIRTLYAEITGTRAEMTVDQTTKGVIVTVISGKVRVRHLRKAGSAPEIVTAGKSLVAVSSEMNITNSSPNLLTPNPSH